MNDRGLDARLSFEEGRSAHRAGDLPKAAAQYRRTLALAPETIDAEHLLAISCLQRGDCETSARLLRSLLRRQSDAPAVAISLGHAEQARGREEAAHRAFRLAALWAPVASAAWLYFGNRAAAAGSFQQAMRLFARSVAINPLDAAALGNLGSALAELQAAVAQTWHRRAAAVGPQSPAAWINVGHGARALGDWEKARGAYRRAHAIDADDALALSEAVHASLQQANWHNLERDVGRLGRLLEQGPSVPPFHLLALELSTTLKRGNAERWSRRYPLAPSRRPERPLADRLRLGYISGDFRQHAVGYQVIGLIEAHDLSRIELYGYSWAKHDGSGIRARLDRGFGGIIDLSGCSDEAAAMRIGADGIEVLIDLGGHTHSARPGILARRPAGVQVGYFGYPGTTGADYHDYAILDAVTAPPGAEAGFSEALVRLPCCFWPHDGGRPPLPAPPSRAALGLPAGVVLACFNQVYKLQPQAFGQWMRILGAAPEAILWLLDPGAVARDNIRRAAARAGVAPERLAFAPPLAHAAHLARVRAADIAIDTLPYGAHVTAADALSVGCPFVTRIGTDLAGRIGASMLTAVGLPELIASDDAGFVEIVVRLAREPSRRALLRARLAEAQRRGPWFDMQSLSRAIEAAAVEMRRRWHQGEPPRSFDVSPVAPR
ncbi:MAG: hypothetical protein HYR63_23625 [Proteobacteria bacterium]|nr:hypothetical protein [Pseudomonadota bacterium]